LLWLAKMATDLPESAGVIERVGQYSDAAIDHFNNAEQKTLYWQLNYLLGRYKYENRQYAEAINLFEKVDRSSPYYVKAQFFTGISNVQLRQSRPAVASFQRILGAIEEGVEGVEDEARMRDLAYLSMARTFYSSSIKLDESTNAPTVDATRLSAAVKYWNKVDSGSEYWLDALFEESWAYFMAGDYSHALGNIHTIQSPYFPNSFYPEADVLKAVIYFTNCQYDDADVITAKIDAKYQPIRSKLAEILNRYQGDGQDEAFFNFLRDVHNKRAHLDPSIAPIVETSLSDRELLRHIEYVRMLDEEASRVKKAKSDFQASEAGTFESDAITEARKGAVEAAGKLARARYQTTLDDLDHRLSDNSDLKSDIAQAHLNQVSELIAGAQVKERDARANVVTPDEEHVLWPFNGEYWRDELGFYRQSIVSKCGR
jgi:tetratricopeptide (TPR) repeat protein